MAADALLAWYDAARRDLPWRRTRDPWAIWVSEVMLQQTRVETAVPFFERFLARFPDPAALAAAPVEAALALWSGLGYYGRCRALHAAARAVVEAGGEIPRRAAELARLPGVGPYTAAAVASIAFGEPVPVLDGNTVRVLARRLALAEDPARATVRRRLLAAAAELLSPTRPGDGNQALMELGATLCSPRAPACGRCPLATGCRAAAAGRPEAYPPPRRRRAPVREELVAAVVERDGSFLLVRRGDGEALLAGLWEFPTVPAEGDPAAALAARYGGRWRLDGELARLAHGVTFRAQTVIARAARQSDGGQVGEGSEAGFFDPAAAARIGLTGVARKLLARLAAAAGRA